jgi:hypothetical protein
MKFRPAVVVLSGQFEHISIGGAPAVRAGTVTREAFEERFVGSGVGVGTVEAVYATDLGLSGEDCRLPEARRRHRLSSSTTAPTAEMLERGRLIVTEAGAAVDDGDLERLRKLCWWFPIVLRIPAVLEYLDGLPLPIAEQVAGIEAGRGRPLDPVDIVDRIATMDELVQQRGLTVAAAADDLARAVPALNVTPKALMNLHAALGPLVSCLGGYAVPVAELSARAWGARGDDQLEVYVKAPSEGGPTR